MKKLNDKSPPRLDIRAEAFRCYSLPSHKSPDGGLHLPKSGVFCDSTDVVSPQILPSSGTRMLKNVSPRLSAAIQRIPTGKRLTTNTVSL